MAEGLPNDTGFVDPKTNNFPGSLAAYCSDGASIVIGSLMGTSPVTVFVGEWGTRILDVNLGMHRSLQQ